MVLKGLHGTSIVELPKSLKIKATEIPQATMRAIVASQFHQSRAEETGPDSIRCFKTLLFEAYLFIQMRMGAKSPGAQPTPCS